MTANGVSDGRPTKKRKVAAPVPESAICIARAEISFSRRYDHGDAEAFKTLKRDIGPFLGVALRGDALLLYSRSTSPKLFETTQITLKSAEISHGAEKIIQGVAYTAARDVPGTIWTEVDASIANDGGTVTVQLLFSLMWNETLSPYYPLRTSVDRKSSQAIIDSVFPQPEPSVSAWSPMDFYEAAYVPPKDDQDALAIQVPSLEAKLFPYQRRTLKWLLHREGVTWSASGRVQPIPADTIPPMDTFRTEKDADGREIYLSDVFHTITRDKTAYYAADKAIKGGILAEEMGLGKTLEILGLILLNKRPDMVNGNDLKDAAGLVKTAATLIVTPESLRQQWITEIATHAPNLRVMHYQGCRKLEEEDESNVVDELAGYDVVITTYSTLSQELHFARDPPERSRRYERAYRRPKSPLVQILWWRVCLDEAQMIESGVSQAASVARVLPRVNAWGITGTPVKDDVKDLLGLLLFLRYHPYCSATQVWTALVTHHKSQFQKLFNSIALRHTKAQVRHEILLPPQKRFVISMPFSAVEEQHYMTLFREMAADCNMDLQGAPLTDEWDPEDHENSMRTWLNRLRQTALHPEVGVYSRRRLGYNKERPMRTIEEVLNAMLEQSEISIRTEERAYLSSRLNRGQLYENGPRVKEALEIWEKVRDETANLVEEAREKLADAIREEKGIDEIQAESSHRVEKSDVDVSSDSEDEVESIEARGRLSELRRRLRSALEMHHKAVFFCANANFQMRDNAEMTVPDSDEFQRLKKLEDEGYEHAKVIRREILRESYRKANRHMTRIAKKASKQLFAEVPELTVKAEKGIESGRVVDRLEVLYGELNEQANIMDEWRESVVQLLLRPLLDEEDDVETTGEELMDSAKFQDDLMVYVQALRSVIADRQDAISGQTNELVRHETETSIKLAKSGGGPAPEKLLALLDVRQKLKPKRAQISMRGAIGELRGLQTRLTRDGTTTAREAVENRIVSDHLKITQTLLGEQNKAAVALESEIETFKDAMNARLEYYRQLQVVSDAVLPFEGDKTDDVEARMKRIEDDTRKKLLTAESKHRYLMNLKETGTKSNEPRMCVICQTPFVTGVLTVCGHQFCKECMMLWYKSHRNCPVCKRQLKAEQLHDIAIKPQQLQIVSEGANSDRANAMQQQRQTTTSKATTIYSEFNADKLAEIKNIDLDGPSFTTKVDTLVRHLLWLRESDPGAKSIIFSQ